MGRSAEVGCLTGIDDVAGSSLAEHGTACAAVVGMVARKDLIDHTTDIRRDRGIAVHMCLESCPFWRSIWFRDLKGNIKTKTSVALQYNLNIRRLNV